MKRKVKLKGFAINIGAISFPSLLMPDAKGNNDEKRFTRVENYITKESHQVLRPIRNFFSHVVRSRERGKAKLPLHKYN